MKRALQFIMLLSITTTFAQFPNPCLVGYWQNWSPMRLSEIHDSYNVIELAFATTKTGTDYDMEFNLPSGYSKSQFLADIDALHLENKVVILSIGGAADPVILDSESKKNTFISTINQILADYDYKIDGIDLDLESTSLSFGTWTMNSPAQGQLNVIDAVKQILFNYQNQTGKRLLLTMAPETVYLQGGLSDWQVNNIHGGAYLPIVEGLMDDLDVIFPQHYNAGGASGGTFANNGQIYYDTGDPDYLTAMTETLIEGFTIKAGKGTFDGVPASKVAIGLPSNDCNAAGTGYVTPQNVGDAVKYLRGKIQKPASFDYTLNSSYPDLRGLMTWSINEDALACSGEWSFTEGYENAFGDITGNNNSIIESDIQLYPTFVNQGEIINLETGSKEFIEFTIINSLGETIFKVNQKTISTENLQSGVYFVKSDYFETYKFTVM